MKKKFLKKKIFIDTKHKHWVIVHLYNKRRAMQKAYKKYCEEEGYSNGDNKFKDVGGVHCAHYIYEIQSKKKDPEQEQILSGNSGTIFLHVSGCSGSTIAHEFGHAVLWILGRKQNMDATDKEGERTGYPITINNIMEEEKLLYNLTEGVRNFYNWYWKVVKSARA